MRSATSHNISYQQVRNLSLSSGEMLNFHCARCFFLIPPPPPPPPQPLVPLQVVLNYSLRLSFLPDFLYLSTSPPLPSLPLPLPLPPPVLLKVILYFLFAFRSSPPVLHPHPYHPFCTAFFTPLHLSLNREGRSGTTDDFITSFLHFSLFFTVLWDLANSRPVHSLMLSSHLFFCLSCHLPSFTVPCKMVLARWF